MSPGVLSSAAPVSTRLRRFWFLASFPVHRRFPRKIWRQHALGRTISNHLDLQYPRPPTRIQPSNVGVEVTRPLFESEICSVPGCVLPDRVSSPDFESLGGGGQLADMNAAANRNRDVPGMVYDAPSMGSRCVATPASGTSILALPADSTARCCVPWPTTSVGSSDTRTCSSSAPRARARAFGPALCHKKACRDGHDRETPSRVPRGQKFSNRKSSLVPFQATSSSASILRASSILCPASSAF
jgi:hypothetical protein